ncbi:MAG TPA: hypothetical protein VGQ83_29680 [Polyangia bacterium]|jgi:hypothetical protein
MRSTSSLVLALWLLAQAPAALAADDAYAVKLSRPAKAGDRYRVVTKGKTRKQQRAVKAGQEVSNSDEAMDVELTAAATVVAVDGRALPVRVSYQVERCQKAAKGETREVVGRGRTIVVEHKNGKTVFTVDGEVATGDTAEALGVVLTAREPDTATDDDIFGTRERRRVGDEWRINGDAAARDLAGRGLKIGGADIAGTARLEGVRKQDGVKALEVSARLRVDRVQMPLPPGMQVDKASVEASFAGLFPVDTLSTRRLADRLQMKVALAMRMKNPGAGEEMVVEAMMEQRVETRYTPLKD